jgi:alkylation response protein AidB-like acyl-CoA dehydrogenase
VQDCIQMHGGIGLTWEHDLHLYQRRIAADRNTYGTPADHRQALAAIREGV